MGNVRYSLELIHPIYQGCVGKQKYRIIRMMLGLSFLEISNCAELRTEWLGNLEIGPLEAFPSNLSKRKK